MAVFNCLASSGAIIYSPDGKYGNDGSGGGYGGGGGTGGGGSVWSDSAQLIWISVNNAPKYPVWLKPGWNEVHFWIPFIFPDDEWVEAPIIIEAPGYILIPAGFEFGIKTDKNAPVEPGNPKMIDKLQFVDVYDIEIQEVPVPVDLDGLFEDIVFEDIHAIDIINATLMAEQSLIENLNLEDVYNVEIESAPFSGEFDNIEEINIEDVNSTTLVNTTIANNNNVEDVEFTDINSNTVINATKSSNNTTEDVEFTDFVYIEK